MNTKRLTMIAALLATPSFAACAHDPTKELVAARVAYDEASKGPANELAPTEVYEASKALALAEQAHDDKPASDKERDLAYVAHRKAELAKVKADQFVAQDDVKKAKQTYVSTLEQQKDSSQQQLAQANTSLDATQKALDAEQKRRSDLQNQLGSAMASINELGKMKQDGGRTVITLDGSVLFTSDSSKLLAPAMGKLQKVAEVISEYGDKYRVRVEGHTDSRGSAGHNRSLSESRAASVREFLVGRGVQPTVITSVGRGEDAPIAPNDTAEGRADNRRVELVIEPVDGGTGAEPK
ncbi:MAG: OmpA family protein [Deltaproteobacteria bacterium]|nr:OmpA family protein [Nannocystaceae bacterium]